MKAVSVLAVALSVAAPTPARAADLPQTYVVPVCATQGGAHPLSGWADESAAGVDECASGGGFGGSAERAFGWAYRAPDDTEVAAVRIWRTGTAGAGVAYELAARERGAAEYSALEATEQLRQGPVAGRDFSGLHAAQLALQMWCDGGECSAAEAWIRVTRMEMAIRDEVKPRVVAVTGTAFAASPRAGTVGVRASFADIGGGLRDAALMVDGAVHARPSPKCVQPYASAVPCPLSGTQDYELDTRALADGKHSLSFELTDVAGNRSVSKSYDVWVQNGSASPGPPLAKTPLVRVSVEWATLNASYGETPVVRATLRDPAGTPLAGLKVAVAVRPMVRGAPFVLDTPAVSDARGRIAVRLPRGPSREVKLTHGEQAATVKVVVRAPLRFAASPAATRNGSTIRLNGSVPGTQTSTKVELQARNGTKWVPFRIVLLRQGRFSARYRFARTFRTTRYRFRAVIHGDSRFPYAAASSRVVSVLVRP